MATSTGWFYWAILSAIFAALTAIFAKIGIQGVDSDLATLIRTAIISKAPSHPSIRRGQAHARLTLFRRDSQWRSDTGRNSGVSILMHGIKAT